MERRNADVVIICPTLDIARAAKTLEHARETAGCPAGVIMVSDYARRGALVVGNVMLAAALRWGARYVCYLNDDIGAFSEGWLARLVDVLASEPAYGVAVASGHCRTKPQCTGRPAMPPGVVECPNPVAYTCAVLKVEMIRRVGEFDEGLRHYGDDTDYEWRARQLGWTSVWVQDVWVDHEQGGWDDAWYSEDRAYLRRKWGR